MILEVRLTQEHSVTVLMWTAELLWLLFVDLQMLGQLVFGWEHLVASLEEGGREGGREGRREGRRREREREEGREGGREREGEG